MKTEAYNIMLPCSQDDFAQFMSGLLGKSQTTEKRFSGSYIIRQKDIGDVYSLIEQRIKQQNNGNLLQFSVKLFFDDGSSNLFTDINDFLAYRDIYSRKSMQVNMQWIYLIKFQDKNIPEKQTISVTCQSKQYFIYKKIKSPFERDSYGNILVTIEHTARTWANDIEMLLTKYFENIQEKPHKIKNFMYQNSGTVGLIFGILIFATFLIGGFITGNIITKFISNDLFNIANDTYKIEEKIDLIIKMYSQNIWPKYYFIFVWYLIISIIVSIIFGVILSDNISNPNIFRIIITETDEKIYTDEKLKTASEPKNIVLSIFCGVSSGLIGNIIFYIITKYFLKVIG